jgi:hypothetical protein
MHSGEIVDIDEVPMNERNFYHLIVVDPTRKPGAEPCKIKIGGLERHGCREW